MRRFIVAAAVRWRTRGCRIGVIGHGCPGGRTLTVVEHQPTRTSWSITRRPAVDSVGDTLAWGNPIMTLATTTRSVAIRACCVRTNPGMSWECAWTTILADGVADG
jgi:hypothetical protein